jgi:hypothetical protein
MTHLLEPGCHASEQRYAHEGLCLDAVKIYYPGRAHAAVERNLIDSFGAGGEVCRRIHVGARVRVKVERARVPAVTLDGLRGFELHATHAVTERLSKVDNSDHGALWARVLVFLRVFVS